MELKTIIPALRIINENYKAISGIVEKGNTIYFYYGNEILTCTWSITSFFDCYSIGFYSKATKEYDLVEELFNTKGCPLMDNEIFASLYQTLAALRVFRG